jgi:hypothetical protein
MLDPGRKNRPDDGIFADARVEPVDQAGDHRIVDAGLELDLRHHLRAPLDGSRHRDHRIAPYKIYLVSM